jgi:hypothetical protein
MPMLRSAFLSRATTGPRRGHTLLALLLWGGVTVFIFGILVDLIR